MSLPRYAVTDEQWVRIEPLIPGKLRDPGATARDNRPFVIKRTRDPETEKVMPLEEEKVILLNYYDYIDVENALYRTENGVPNTFEGDREQFHSPNNLDTPYDEKRPKVYGPPQPKGDDAKGS